MDMEADGFFPTMIYCLVLMDQSGNIFSTTDYDQMRSFLTKEDIVLVGHNIQRFDIPHLERILGIKIKAKLVDTLAVSWYLYPTKEDGSVRVKHGLEEWGEEFGIPKPKIEDWFNLTIEEYLHRCTEDVKINNRLWKNMWLKLRELYKVESEIWRFLEYLTFKMHCARLQEESGWKLDVKYAEQSLAKLLKEKEEKTDALQKVMPKVPVYKKKSVPKRMYNSSGTLSKIGQSWLELIEQQNLPKDVDEIEYLDGYEEPNPNSHQQIKDWLFNLGWVPETIKTVKNKKTGETKQIPQINKEAQKGGGLCDSIKKLYEKEPNLELLDGLSVLNHRIGLLSGFLRDCSESGVIRARIAGLTNTLRFKHSEIVNLPKVNRPYGEEVRGCLIAYEGHELCGADKSSLEDRLKQHFIFPLDPDYVHSMMKDDFDPHVELAGIAGMMTPSEVQAYKNGDHSKKKIRDIAKNGNYACQYGAYPPRLAITCGISLEKAQELFDAYWEMNWAIKEVTKRQTVKKLNNGEKWLLNPVNLFWYSLRNDNDIFSTLVQGTASYCFDRWVFYILEQREQLTGQFHDEVVLCIKIGHRKEAEELLYNALRKTNEELNLNRELDIGVQFGNRYSEIH